MRWVWHLARMWTSETHTKFWSESLQTQTFLRDLCRFLWILICILQKQDVKLWTRHTWVWRAFVNTYTNPRVPNKQGHINYNNYWPLKEGVQIMLSVPPTGTFVGLRWEQQVRHKRWKWDETTLVSGPHVARTASWPGSATGRQSAKWTRHRPINCTTTHLSAAARCHLARTPLLDPTCNIHDCHLCVCVCVCVCVCIYIYIYIYKLILLTVYRTYWNADLCSLCSFH